MAIRKKYDFSSVGESKEDFDARSSKTLSDRVLIPIGIKVPVELGTDRFDEEAVRRIRRTTEKYMPFVQLLTFEPLVDRRDNKDVAKVGVRITYKVSALSQRERIIEAIVYTAG